MYKMESTLRESLVPIDPQIQNVSEAEALHVLKAIEILAKMADEMIGFLKHTQTRPAPEKWPLTRQEVKRYWKGGILSWFTFLFDHYHPPLDSEVPSRLDTINYVSCVFTYFIKVNIELVSSTPGAGRLATRLWFVTDYDYVRSKYSVSAGWWDPGIYLLCPDRINYKPLAQNPELAAEFYSVEGVSRKSMIHLILTRMDNTTTVYNDQDAQLYARLVGFLIDFDTDTYGDVPFKRIARVVSKTTAHLAVNIRPKDQVHQLHLACLSYFEHLQLILGDGALPVDVIVTAIRSGLLRAFVEYSGTFTKLRSPENKCFQHVTNYSVEAAIEIITDIIPRYMMYTSVILAIENEFKCIKDGKVAASIINTTWQKFKQLFEFNKAILDSNQPRLTYCDNMKHDINLNSGTLLKCSRCEYARYCSKQCQKEDWVARHRNDRDCRKGDHPLRKRDQLSLCRFPIMTTKLQWKSIEERARREYPNVPLSQIAVLYDFKEYPYQLHLRTLKSNMLSMKAAEYVPNATVVQCLVNFGTYEWAITTAENMNDIENKSWVTRRPQPIRRFE